MSCDIHAVFQKKTPDGWEDVKSVYEENRHYALFAWLGNVRNGYDFLPLSDHRGFPEDFDVTDREDHGDTWMGDHSHSWLADDEIINGSIPPDEDHFAYFIDEVKRLKELHGEVRMVFGFDS